MNTDRIIDKPTELEINFKESPVSVTYGNGQIGYIGVTKLEDYFQFIRDPDGSFCRKYGRTVVYFSSR